MLQMVLERIILQILSILLHYNERDTMFDKNVVVIRENDRLQGVIKKTQIDAVWIDKGVMSIYLNCGASINISIKSSMEELEKTVSDMFT